MDAAAETVRLAHARLADATHGTNQQHLRAAIEDLAAAADRVETAAGCVDDAVAVLANWSPGSGTWLVGPDRGSAGEPIPEPPIPNTYALWYLGALAHNAAAALPVEDCYTAAGVLDIAAADLAWPAEHSDDPEPGEASALLSGAAETLREAAAVLTGTAGALTTYATDSLGISSAAVPTVGRWWPGGPAIVGAPHGGHGGDHVPPARTCVTDPLRAAADVLAAIGPTNPDAVDPDLVHARYLLIDHAGHAGLRHEGRVTDAQLHDRALHRRDPITGTTTDWETGRRHRCSRHATAFTTPAALVAAEAHAWLRGAGERRKAEHNDRPRFIAVVKASDVFGPGFRRHLRGRTRVGTTRNPIGTRATVFDEGTVVEFVYQRRGVNGPWTTLTGYGRPGEQTDLVEGVIS